MKGVETIVQIASKFHFFNCEANLISSFSNFHFLKICDGSVNDQLHNLARQHLILFGIFLVPFFLFSQSDSLGHGVDTIVIDTVNVKGSGKYEKSTIQYLVRGLKELKGLVEEFETTNIEVEKKYLGSEENLSIDFPAELERQYGLYIEDGACLIQYEIFLNRLIESIKNNHVINVQHADGEGVFEIWSDEGDVYQFVATIESGRILRFKGKCLKMPMGALSFRDGNQFQVVETVIEYDSLEMKLIGELGFKVRFGNIEKKYIVTHFRLLKG